MNIAVKKVELIEWLARLQELVSSCSSFSLFIL